jgi:predicted adenine nucleotide alpha hydrolase (AANH) superfamily ATPase
MRPRLLLHSCCGPCSSYVLEYLSKHFAVTVFYYNPNIWPEAEFHKRAEVQRTLVSRLNPDDPAELVVADYRPEEFVNIATGLETEPEGGKRCRRCFALRLEEAARYAGEHAFDYFTTTLSVSPHKDAAVLNELGGTLAEKYGVPFLFADFKKRGGYKRSIELSGQYGLYRQNYCGCRYSYHDGGRALAE